MQLQIIEQKYTIKSSAVRRLKFLIQLIIVFKEEDKEEDTVGKLVN